MIDHQQMTLNSGIAAFEAKQFSRALQLLTPLAETGDANAQYRLAIMCQNGLGQVRNEQLAHKWMKRSAEQDHGLAMHGLGYMYLDGDCTTQDECKAASCFERAADLGLEGSMIALALMYHQGRGVRRDSHKARSLYAKAGFNPDELADY